MKIKVKKDMDFLEMVNCLRHPTKKAYTWTGHVIDQKSKKPILAGWCGTKCHMDGFFGWVESKK